MKVAIFCSEFFQNIHQNASIVACFQKFRHEINTPYTDQNIHQRKSEKNTWPPLLNLSHAPESSLTERAFVELLFIFTNSVKYTGAEWSTKALKVKIKIL